MKSIQNYDSQAKSFDQRTGFSPDIAYQIAQLVKKICQPAKGEELFEIGAGTGVIGMELAKLASSYTGFDLSEPMLKEFRKRLEKWHMTIGLYVADGCQKWPASDHSIHILFSSRTLHLFPVDHIVQEVDRIAHLDKSILLIGRKEREKMSIRSQMQRKMRQLMSEYGFEGRNAQKHRQQLFSILQSKGASILPKQLAAQWSIKAAPIDSLNAWRSKPGLGGVLLHKEQKSKLLSCLEQWACNRFGDIHQPHHSQEFYWLYGIQLHD